MVMNARVDDDARRAEQLRLQQAELSRRIVFVDAQLVGDALRVQRPTFGVSGEPHQPAKQRELAGAFQDTELKVMARNGFVMCQREQAPQRQLARRFQIERKRAGLVADAVAVERARCAVFDRDRNAFHQQPILAEWFGSLWAAMRGSPRSSLRAAAEQLLASGIVVRHRKRGSSVQRLDALTDRAGLQSLLLQALIELRRDVGDELQASRCNSPAAMEVVVLDCSAAA